MPGTRGLEQETAAPALRQLTVWGRQLSEVAQADTSTGEGPLPDRVLGKAAGKDRCLNACGPQGLRQYSAATQLE